MKQSSRTPALPVAMLAATACAVALSAVSGASGASGWAWAGVFLAEWLLMTGAMMLPSSVPFLGAVTRIGGRAAALAAAGAYIAAWGVLGIGVSAALWLAGGMLAAQPPGVAPRLAGASLLAAALYQLTPFAMSCQRACAQPFAILARCWRGPGRAGNAWRAGLYYALNCMGCCVAIIVAMVVVGVHDLLWMLAFAVLMVLQKHPAWKPVHTRVVAAAAAAAGLALALDWWRPALYGLRAVCAA